MPSQLELALLLADANDGTPLVSQSFSQQNAKGMDDPRDERISGKMADPAVDPNDLTKQRYGVLAPEGARGARLLSLMRPLLDSRKADQGGVPILEKRLPANVGAIQARTIRDDLLRENAPRYWLVLGDFDEVSLETTFAFAARSFVGRLGFSQDADYESYVDKVLRWERAPYTNSTGQTVLSSVRDGSVATGLARRALLSPLEETCSFERETQQFSTSRIMHIDVQSLSDIKSIMRTKEPTVLFSAAHGAGPPRGGYTSHEEQRRLSGAMCLGPEKLTAEDAHCGDFLPGGIWFYMACYGAGTPARSAFAPWLAAMVQQRLVNRDAAAAALLGLPANGTAPFLAALPKAALANPDGPLAIIGHVDLAWSASFTEPGAQRDRQTMRFFGALRALVEGRRAGIAHGELSRFLLDTALALSDLYEEESSGNAPLRDQERDVHKAHLWMRRHDLGHYILLGDPAVRLPLAHNRVVRVLNGEPMDIDTMEKAVLAVLGRGESPDVVAQQMNLDANNIVMWVHEYAAAGKERLQKIWAMTNKR